MNLVTVLKPPFLAITSVNGGANPTAGAPFSVVVQSQYGGGLPTNVTANTTVALSLTTGLGTLGGTLTGTILAGTNSTTITGITYTKAESGVILGVKSTGGKSLSPGVSAAFTVNAGAATTLVMTSGNNQSGKKASPLGSPFVVTVADIFGNGVSGTNVTFALGSAPSGATGQSLSATLVASGANGQAASTLTLGSTTGVYTVTASAGSLSGSPITFSASALPGNYVPLVTATNEYQICFKCHSGYAWLPGSPPAGVSSNGTAAKPIETDCAVEFSPMNMSGHPIVTGLANYPNALAPKGLAAAQLRPPWNVNVGTQTMLCSDCHNTDSASPAAQGPHGSATPFMLRVFPGGPAPATWPTATSFTSSWCYNCHNDVSGSWDGHANHHGAGGCNACHIVVPHGGKVSRLIALAGTYSTMPARYGYNTATNGVVMASFKKGSSYSESSSCKTTCSHHSGGPVNETW